MGIHHEHGYSAYVSAFLRINGERIEVERIGRDSLFVCEDYEIGPGVDCELVVVVDGHEESQRITLNDGLASGQRHATFSVAAPF